MEKKSFHSPLAGFHDNEVYRLIRLREKVQRDHHQPRPTSGYTDYEASHLGFLRWQRWRDQQNKPKTSLKVPCHADIAIGNRPYEADENNLYAIDSRYGREVRHYPTKYPDNPEVQQGFMCVVKGMLQLTTKIAATLG
jgi:hypothetical protein